MNEILDTYESSFAFYYVGGACEGTVTPGILTRSYFVLFDVLSFFI